MTTATGAAPVPGPASSQQIQRVAWTIMWAGFLALIAIVAGSILAVTWFVNTSTTSRSAEVKIIGGTVLVQETPGSGWVATREDSTIGSGASLRTVDSSEALVRLFDGTTVRLFPNSEMAFPELRVGRFDPDRQTIVIMPRSGRARIGVPPLQRGLERTVTVSTPGGDARLEEGQYNLSVTAGGVTLNVLEFGQASVSSGAGETVARPGDRLVLAPGLAPVVPAPTTEQLLANGEFEPGLEPWRAGNISGFRLGQDVEGTVEVVPIDGRQAVHFIRTGSRGTHNESYVFQPVNRDVSGYARLTLSAEFRIIAHNLGGGGFEGSEYPVKIRVNYRTSNGQDHFKVWGFYVQNETGNRTDSGTQVRRDEWVTWTAPDNLMTLLPTPAEITSVQISASGWDYESYVSRIILIGD